MNNEVKRSFYIRVAIALSAALLFSTVLINSLFISRTTDPDWNSFHGTLARLQNSMLEKGFELGTLLVKTEVGKIIPSPTPIFSSNETEPLPPETENPIVLYPTDIQTIPPTNTLPLPTHITEPTPTTYTPPIPISTSVPTRIPPTPTTKLKKPTKTPPTPTTKPTIPTPAITKIPNPLQQKWYGNGSLACYTQDRFIKVYANGVTPDSCRNNVRAAVEAQNTSVKLLGRTITVHKKAYTAFKAVADTLEQYKKDSTHYDFPSKKNYEIRNVGAYVFRCNVNASTSDKFDTCSSGCVLSPHAFGVAVDINYDTNQNGSNNYDMPKEIWETFESYGFRCGGHYPLIGSYIDAMHFEYMVELCEGV